MNIMQINSNSLYNIGNSYNIKLNERETLVVEDDPLDKERVEAKKLSKKREKETQKAEEIQKKSQPNELSKDEERLVKDLASRDSEVKAHEAAHQSAGGGMTGAASYSYQQGPDGKMYAIGGEVSISSPKGSTPEETIKNARQVVASAMAAGSPSPQDFAVASSARMMEIQAQQQKTKELQEQRDAQTAYSTTATPDLTQKDKNFPSLDISA